MAVTPHYHDEERSDVTDYQALLAGPWELDYQQLSAGPFRASNAGCTLGRSAIYEEAFNRAVGVRGALRPGLVAFCLADQRTRALGRWWGRNHPADAVPFATGRNEIDVAFPEGYRNILLVLPERMFRQHYREISDEDADFLDRALPLCPVAPAAFTSCRATLADLLARQSDRNLSEEAMASLIAGTLASGMAAASEPSRRSTPSARSRLAREAVGLWTESGFELSLRDLSRLLGVSQRTLEHAFRDCFDVTPYQYLKCRRLGLAREALRQADPKTRSVTEIAMDFGFHELGRFAGDYRRFFGELPSETLASRVTPRSATIFVPTALRTPKAPAESAPA